ncbi:plant UBX domain-containing protein 1 isoform X2 [Morus notabilis]|uniref:plant UBX domain-containing protein 1 isoform X2 n=1 Tax=Morus notabilis TaxID=981085 RepID=UPI000CED5EFC|nr:plant UBX domain-containing protein 1 isoform X2 [Morus notabilis]
MIVDRSSPLTLKRRRLTNVDPMEAQAAKAKLASAKEKFGREIRVFETSPFSSSSTEESKTEEPDEFYEFSAEDYYRIMATKKEDKYLKTRKIREAEEAARRSRITKAVIRLRFPDNHTLEATFHPSEKIQSLVDLLVKVIAKPDWPFYLWDDDAAAWTGPFLRDEIISLKGLELITEQEEPAQPEPAPEPVHPAPTPVVEERRPAEKKPIKPKWLKL